MQNIKNILLASTLLLLFSCGSESGDVDAGLNKDKQPTSSTKGNTKVSECLATFDYDYSRLLTKEDVLKHVKIADPSVIEVDYQDNKKMNAKEYGECAYKWPSNRPNMEIKVSKVVQKIPDANIVSVTKLMFKDGDLKEVQERFHRAYKKLSEKEADEMYATMDKQFKDKSPEALETAKGFIKTRTKLNFEPIEGLGDFAYWTQGKQLGADWGVELIVLVGKATFTIKAKISSDVNDNLAIAQKLAKEVLAKCP